MVASSGLREVRQVVAWLLLHEKAEGRKWGNSFEKEKLRIEGDNQNIEMAGPCYAHRDGNVRKEGMLPGCMEGQVDVGI